MPLAAGERLGLYEIVAPLGAGGMGEVYRARDGKLGRDVAIKVLPQDVKEHPDRLARFEREAKLLAGLNHPGIATLHGIEESDSRPFLVMEVVEGETLAERIARGRIPADEALPIARQIADALEAAHEKGVVHRDLKPANVKIDPDGRVKVLDFGLAKALAGDDEPQGDLSQSPTLSHDTTRAGIILGTAAYMSPEQAKGKAVDRRSDVFSFGAVLFEMLTGRKAFAGEDVSDVLAAVLRAEPDWKALPADLDPGVEHLLRRCLRKERRQRLQSIGDARLEVEDVLTGPSVAHAAPDRRALALTRGLATALGLALLAVLWILWPVAAPPRPPVRLSVDLGLGDARLFRTGGGTLALSPDGSALVVVGQAADGRRQLYLRSFDSLEARPLPDTEDAAAPFFSPDGRWVGFVSSGSLKKVPVGGGAVVTLVEAPDARGGARVAAWGPDDTILYTPNNAAGLYRVSASGGEPTPLTQLGDGEQSHRMPCVLPNGRAVLFVAAGTDRSSFDDASIEALLLDTGERRVLQPGGSYPLYASSGHLLFVRGTTLFAAPFDAGRVELTGDPHPVLEGVATSPLDGVAYVASAADRFVYLTPGSERALELVWVDRGGAEEILTEVLQPYQDPRLSPDDRQLAVEIDGHVWLLDLRRGSRTPLTREGFNFRPVWSPDGERVLFGSSRGETVHVYSKRADGAGAAEQLTTGPHRVPTAVSSDGRTILFRETTTKRDIGMVRLDGDREPVMLLDSAFDEHTGMLSPDDRWLAYVSNESGRDEVYVTRFPELGGRLPISVDGGAEPRWSRDGRELFYRNGRKLMAVAIAAEPELRAGPPLLLFEGPYQSIGANTTTNYDVTADGRRFVMVKPVEGSQGDEVVLVQNFLDELKRLVPTN